MTTFTATLRHRAAALLLLLCLAVTACQTSPAPRGFSSEQVALLRAEGFVETEDGWQLSLADQLLFDVDSSSVQPTMQASLTRLANGLLQVGISAARVEGHTDSTGSHAHNQQLSAERARSVAAVLQAHGFAAADLAVRGWGETRPVADNGTAEGRRDNRRVVIIVSAL